jgi:hypothetical protein
MVSHANFGELTVWHQGLNLKGLSSRLAISDSGEGEIGRPALLVIAHEKLDCGAFEAAANTLCFGAAAGMAPTGRARWGAYSGSSAYRAEDHVVLPPTLLPESWIDYSGLDIVAVALPTLARMPAAAREAILKWAECGGTLLIFGVGAAAPDSKEFARLFEGHPAAGAADWASANPADRREITVVNPEASPSGGPASSMGAVAGPLPVLNAGEQDSAAAAWPLESTTFAYREFLLGRVYAFPGNPFPGTPHDWAWWLNSLGPARWNWTGRTGISARAGNPEFLSFLIPGVGEVPVYSFLVLITLFAITIGPLNYFLLWKRRQLYLLVLTIPAIAFFTSCTLFCYAVLADGFGVKSRVRSFTVLDQASKTAVAVNRIALYTGLAPSAGLLFGPESAVFPIRPSGEQFESGHVDWRNNNQHLTAGWLRSGTRTQFLTTTHRVERSRLEVQPGQSADTRQVSNGLPWDLNALVVADSEGGLYFGRLVPAGAGAELARIDPQAVEQELGKILDLQELKLPASAAHGGDLFPTFDPRRGFFPGAPNAGGWQFDQSLLQQNLDALVQIQKPTRNTLVGSALQQKRPFYLALTAQNPGTEIGLPGTSERQSLHVIFGRY